MVLSKITGLGKQTIEALKDRVLSLDEIVTGDYQSVSTTLTSEAGSVSVDVPDSAKILFLDLTVPAGSTTSSATVRCREDTTWYDVSRINSAIATSGVYHSGAIIYRIPGGVTFAITKSGASAIVAATQMSIRKAMSNVNRCGVVADSATATFPEGTVLTVYYK